MSIDLKPGDTIRRTELHERYGGRRQGGISPSRTSGNVFLITAPDKSDQYGYIYDGFSDRDGFLHYTGEGQFGDQQMAQGNRAVRDHQAEARELHYFIATGTELAYQGEFRYVDHSEPDAPETGNPDETRKVIVFRLEQLTGSPPPLKRRLLDRLDRKPIVEIEVERQLKELVLIEHDREPYEAERREQTLVLAFATALERDGHDVCRLQLWPDGEEAPLFCDVYDKSTRTVFEAKGTVARPAIRMAIGQLADYARLIDPEPARALLLPERPRPDLMDLVRSQGILVVYRDGNSFVTAE